MKTMRITLLSLLCMASSLVNAQLNHYPHGQEILFSLNDRLIRASFDSSYIEYPINSSPAGNNQVLIEYGRSRLPHCDSTSAEKMADEAFMYALGSYYFQSTPDSLHLFFNQAEIGRIARYPILGDQMVLSSGRTLSVAQRVFFNSTLGSDSAWVIDEIQGKQTIHLLIGDSLGWIQIEHDKDELLQLEHVHANQLTYNTPTWLDFFPERAGDQKQYRTFGDYYRGDKGFLDSFINVQVFKDSIYREFKRWTLDSYYNWREPIILKGTVYEQKNMVLDLFFDSLYIAQPIVLIADELLFHPSLYRPNNTIGWKFSWNCRGDGIQYTDTCQLFQKVFNDMDEGQSYSSYFGIMHDYYNSHTYFGYELIGAKVGIHSIGKLNLSVEGFDKPNLSVYPNPSAQDWLIDGANVDGMGYTIYSSDGKTIQSGTIDLQRIQGSNVEPGLYFLSILGPGWTIHHRILKK